MKILIIASYTKSISNFRGDLIRQIVRNGHEVVATAPEEDDDKEITEMGARFIKSPLERTSKNLINDAAYLLFLSKIIRKEQFDLVLSYTIKPVVYGSIAAKINGVKRIASIITGTSFIFEDDRERFVQRTIAKILYWISLKFNYRIFIQNATDARDMIRHRLIKESQIIFINGSGVNLERYPKVPLERSNTFLMITRLLREKGVIEYISAAKIVKQAYPDAKFLLAGPFDENPSCIKSNELEDLTNDGNVEYIGVLKDVRPALSSCRVFVLPSYREGTPRTVLEAMAMGRAIITTDAPGCRETVIDGCTGILVPPKSIEHLASSMSKMIENRELAERMAESGYKLCKERFDVRVVNKEIITALGLY